jgi:protein phosphatase
MLMENRNALTRCIGQPPPLESECTEHTILPKDRYLLSSDGITRFIEIKEIAEIVANATDPEAAARQLVDRANDRGGLDNSTAVVLFFD